MGIFSKKEKAEKQPENAETTAPVQEQQKDNGTATVNPPTPPPPPAEEKEKAEKQPETKDKPAIAPVNISYVLKGRIAVTGIRLVNGQLIYTDGLKVVKMPISKDLPVTITIRQ